MEMVWNILSLAGLAILLGAFVFSIGLSIRVARRRKGKWRWLPALPLLAVTVQASALGAVVVSLLSAFSGVAALRASERATALARGISEAMNIFAFGSGAALILLIVGLALAIVGALGSDANAPSPRQPP